MHVAYHQKNQDRKRKLSRASVFLSWVYLRPLQLRYGHGQRSNFTWVEPKNVDKKEFFKTIYNKRSFNYRFQVREIIVLLPVG